MFKRVLIANRGEIAARIIKSCQNLNIESFSVYSEADKDLAYLKEATKAIHIGEAPASKSYLNQDVILQVALDYDCEAIHPGYGFLSENHLFATRCEQQKLTFIGPKPWQIKRMGDKATAIKTMKEAGLQVLPGSSSILKSTKEAKKFAEKLGYPVLLKASAGGGGKGMRLVKKESELDAAFLEAQTESSKAFSSSDLYLEKFIEGARHIEFQILADNYNNVICLGERECSIQKRHQKLLEESPAPGFSENLREKISNQIIKAIKQIGYLGAGTLEFLLDKQNSLYFMEMNTRIQVEHPITEMVTGLDLINWQIKIACGERLEIKKPKLSGHAIECRINAEAPGVVSKLSLPKNIRFDTYLAKHTQVTPYYDSMLGKIIAHSDSREQALKLMKKALSELKIEGVKTNLRIQQAIIEDKRFIDGKYNCSFIEGFKWPK